MRYPFRRGASCISLVSLSLVLAGACSNSIGEPTTLGSTGSAPGSSQLALTRKADTLSVDQSLKLVPIIPATAGIATSSLAWSSSDTTVAIVTQAGLVFGLKSGIATVSVSANGSTDATKVVVRPSVRYVQFDADTLALGLSQEVKLPYHAVDSDGNPVDLAAHSVQWVSSAPDVAPLSGEGGVVGRALGGTDVRLSVDGKMSFMRVQVKPQAVSSVSISPKSLNVQPGATRQLAAVVLGVHGDTLRSRVVAWSTSNAAVATVDSKGLLTAIAAGTINVTAVCERKHNAISVSVGSGSPPPADTTTTPVPVPAASIAVTLNASALTIGQTTQANATVKDATGNTLTNRDISWTSSDPTIASVDSTGRVSALRAGSAVITGSVDGVSANAVLVVSAPALVPATIAVSASASTLKVGAVAQMTAVVKDASGTVIANAPVSWSSTPTSVATVSVNGAVLARAPGTATVSASTGSLSKSITLTVVDTTTPPPVVARVAVTLATSTLSIGATTQASAMAYDATGQTMTGASVAWSSSNSGVATVNGAGAVVAAGAGTATIRATIGGQVGSANVTVNSPTPPPSGIPISPGQSIQSAVSANPNGTTFIIKAGTHVNQSVTPKDGDRFIGEPGAILDGGGTVVSAFSSGSARPANVTIRGLEIRNYGATSSSADFYGVGAITGGGNSASDGTRGWMVDSNYIHDNRGQGLRIGHTMTVRGNRIVHNAGPFALSGIGDSTLIVGNELATSNYVGTYNPGFGAGGFKIVLSTGVVIRGNNIHNNTGYGAWGDIANRSMTFDGNTIDDNTHAGIFYEISYGCLVTNNIVRRNGLGNASNWMYPAGILIAHSPDCEVSNNTVTDNVHGIVGIQQTRTDDMVYGPHVLERLWVHDNTITHDASGGYAAGIGSGVGSAPYSATANNRFDRNRYSVTSANGSPFTWADGGRSWTSWRGYGQDLSGTFGVR
jgi:parallel beta-helix repeat protein